MVRVRPTTSARATNRKVTTSSDGTYKCSVCSKSFTRKEHLFRHEKVHSGGKRLGPPCFFCEASCASDNRTNHIKALHTPSSAKTPCEACKFAWCSRRDSVDAHRLLCPARRGAKDWMRDPHLGIFVREDVEYEQYEKHIRSAEEQGWETRSNARALAIENLPPLPESPRESPTPSSTSSPPCDHVPSPPPTAVSASPPIPSLSQLQPELTLDSPFFAISNGFPSFLNCPITPHLSLASVTSDPYRYALHPRTSDE